MACALFVKCHACLGPGGWRGLGLLRLAAFRLRAGREGSLGERGRAWRGQRIVYGVAHGLVDFTAVAKAHFDLGGVYVDVDASRVDLDVQGVHRLLVAVQHVLVGAARCMGQHLVAHEAAVDVAELLVGGRARGVGYARTASDMHAAFPVVHGDGVTDEVIAQHVGQPPVHGIHTWAGRA